MGTLDWLKTVLTPPAACRYRPDADAGRQLREVIGKTLPAGYAEFLACYGPGYIRTADHDLNFLTVYDPATILRQNGVFFRALGGPLPRPGWPQIDWTRPGGWLIWGYSCDGHQYYWRMEGEPDAWPTVVEDRYSDAREEFALSLPAFLHAVLTGGIDPRGVPSAIKSSEEKPIWVQSGGEAVAEPFNADDRARDSALGSS